jgi:hypothetical protein
VAAVTDALAILGIDDTLAGVTEGATPAAT